MRAGQRRQPGAQVNVSNDHSRALVSPPKPAQRAIGRKKSKPPSSAIFAAATLSGQVAFQRSGTVVSARPPSALVEKTPSLKRLGPEKGMRHCITASSSGARSADRRTQFSAVAAWVLGSRFARPRMTSRGLGTHPAAIIRASTVPNRATSSSVL